MDKISQPGLVVVMAVCLSAVRVTSVYIRPVKFPNGTIGVEVVQTDDRISSPGDQARPAAADIDMEAFQFPLTKQDVTWLGSLLRLPEEGELRIRKEYRVLTDKERRAFHRALNALKNNTSVSLNKYDLLANIHSRSSANQAAHAGPGFLGWHRVFLLMVENALRQVEPDVTIPYWDITLDERMDKSYKSIIWSSEFLGSGHGSVIDGPFRHWDIPFGFGHLRRLVAAQGRLMTEGDIGRIMSQKQLANISYFSARLNTNLEALHNRIHVWVGGQMRKIEIGAFDPVFYILHSFVDKIWYDFRSLQRTEGLDPEKDYPRFYGRAGHAPLAPMGLGSLTVLDGLSDVWGQRVQYLSWPTCNRTAAPPTCGSPYLQCISHNKLACVSLTNTDRDLLSVNQSQTDDFSNHGKTLDPKTVSIENSANSTGSKSAQITQNEDTGGLEKSRYPVTSSWLQFSYQLYIPPLYNIYTNNLKYQYVHKLRGT